MRCICHWYRIDHYKFVCFYGNIFPAHIAASLEQLDKLLVLLLGCVVQCDSKGPLIERLKTMDLAQQQTLVGYIQQVTDTTDYVCSIDWNDLEDIPKP